MADAPQLSITGDPNKVTIIVGAQGHGDFPKRLDEGEVGCVGIEYRDVAHALLRAGHTQTAEIKAVCKDSTGRVFEGEPWTINVSEWLNMGG